MIINREKMICVITPPKTGSTSFHIALEKKCTIVEGCQFFNTTTGTHTLKLPCHIENIRNKFTYYILTRHPYKRLLSLYGEWLRNKQIHKIKTFEHFVKRIVMTQHSPFYSLPISAWKHNFSYLYPHFNLIELPLLKSEQILKEKHDIDFALLQYNKSEHLSECEEYTEDIIELAKYWAGFDFEWFDYDPEPWWNVKKNLKNHLTNHPNGV